MLCAFLLITFCSCDAFRTEPSYDRATIQSNSDSAADYIKSIIDTSQMDENMRNDDFSTYKTWSGGYGIANDTIDAELEIDDKFVVLGDDTPQDIADMGFTVKIENENLEPGQMESFSPSKNGKSSSLSVINNTKKMQKTMELPLYQFLGSVDSFSLSFKYHGITKGFTLKDIVDIIGAPKSSVSISASSTGTDITLDYYGQNTVDGHTCNDNLIINLKYDANKNIAELDYLSLTRTIVE